MRRDGICRSFGRAAIVAWRDNVLLALPHFTLVYEQELASWHLSLKRASLFQIIACNNCRYYLMRFSSIDEFIALSIHFFLIVQK